MVVSYTTNYTSYNIEYTQISTSLFLFSIVSLSTFLQQQDWLGLKAKLVEPALAAFPGLTLAESCHPKLEARARPLLSAVEMSALSDLSTTRPNAWSQNGYNMLFTVRGSYVQFPTQKTAWMFGQYFWKFFSLIWANVIKIPKMPQRYILNILLYNIS